MKEQMRAEFEAWLEKFSSAELTKDDDGDYIDWQVQISWCGFKAAWQHQQAKIDSYQAALAAVPANHTGNSNEMVQSQQPTYDIEAIKKRMSEIKSHKPAENVQFTELPPVLSMSQFTNKADYEAAMQSQAQQPAQELVKIFSDAVNSGSGIGFVSDGKLSHVSHNDYYLSADEIKAQQPAQEPVTSGKPFQTLADLLPEGFMWGDNLTPDTVLHIALAAQLKQSQAAKQEIKQV